MKKITIISLIIISILFLSYKLIFKKTTNNDLIKVRVAEVAHSSFYTPFYVAKELGYFKNEGLDIDLILTPGADKVSAAVLSNDVEIGFAGAESAIYVYKQNESDYLQLFAGVTKRDGQFIVSRKKYDNFNLQDLYNKKIIVGRSTGMPALNFLNSLKNNNIDKNKINIDYSIEFQALSGSFIGGNGDFVNLFEPNATALVNQGYGHIVANVGLLSKEVPYTAFYARKSYIDKNNKVIKKFTNALNKGIQYTMNNNELEVAKSIINLFPDTSIDDLSNMIKNYKDYDCWLNNPYIDENIFKNLEEFLIEFKLLDNYVPYNDLVNNFYNE